jgi:hypothetical protein
VAVGAATKPLGLIVRNRMVVRSTPLVSQVSSHSKPSLRVSGAGAGNSVSYFM